MAHDGTHFVAQLREACATCGVRGLCLPSGLNRHELRALGEVLRDRRPLPAGATLFHAGSRFESLHLVRAGCLVSVMPSADGESQVLGFHLPGDIVGLDGLGTHVHGCSAVALERSRVCEIPLHSIHELACRVPSMRETFDRIIGQRIQTEHEHIAMMGKRLAKQRLAVFLLDFSERARRLHRDPQLFRLSMSRSDIASYLGLALETVSRLFSRFQELGLIEVERRLVRLIDVAGLRAIAEGEAVPELRPGMQAEKH